MKRDAYKVFSRGDIGGLTLKNRLVRSATYEAGMTEEGKITDGLLTIFKDLAKGGVGLIVTGFMAVSPEGQMAPKMGRIWNDGYVDEISTIPAVVHGADNSCKVFAQIVHAGRQKVMDLELVGPSAVPSLLNNKTVRALSIEEVLNIIKSFADAIARVKRAGFDGVQLHGAHGYLLSSFLSPYTNRRTDDFGGSVKKRVNIIRQIVSSAREKVGDFPLIIKMNCDDFVEGGVTADSFAELAAEVANGGVDAIEISGGIWDCLARSEEELGFFPLPIPESRTRIGARDKQSYFRSYAEKLDVSVPIILVGGNRNIDYMEEIIGAGKIEFLSLCRPFICEPDLPNRWLEVRGGANTECLSCNLCILTLNEGPVQCLVKKNKLKRKDIEQMTPFLWKLTEEEH